MAIVKFYPLLTNSEFIKRSNHYKPLRHTSSDSFSAVLTEFVDNEEVFRFSLDLPGVKAADLSVIVENGIIRITGSRNRHYNGVKRSVRFSKTFQADPTQIDTSQLTANLSEGVLTISAPKLPKPQPRIIDITTHPHASLLESDTEKRATIEVETVDPSEQEKDNE